MPVTLKKFVLGIRHPVILFVQFCRELSGDNLWPSPVHDNGRLCRTRTPCVPNICRMFVLHGSNVPTCMKPKQRVIANKVFFLPIQFLKPDAGHQCEYNQLIHTRELMRQSWSIAFVTFFFFLFYLPQYSVLYHAVQKK